MAQVKIEDCSREEEYGTTYFFQSEANKKKTVTDAGAGSSSKKRRIKIGTSKNGGREKIPYWKWSLEDELLVLNRMVELEIRVQVDSWPKFYAHIKCLLQPPTIELSQLERKVNHLKRDYEELYEIVSEGGELQDPHDRKCYPLMVQIWGYPGILRDVPYHEMQKEAQRRREENLPTLGDEELVALVGPAKAKEIQKQAVEMQKMHLAFISNMIRCSIAAGRAA